jgi:hypothetical protein
MNIKKKLLEKKAYIAIAIVALIVFSITLLPDIITELRIKYSQQGVLPFSEIETKSIENESLKQWVDENYQNKGIYIYEGEKNSKYVLLSSGKQNSKSIDIQVTETLGKEDKIVVNGEMILPKGDTIAQESYPHKLLKIDVRKDPREVVLGTLNLYDAFRGIEYIEQAVVESVIISKINEDTISLISLQGEEKVHICSLTEETKEKIKNDDIGKGDIANIKINYESETTYPTLERITKTKSTVEKILITEVLDEDNLIKVKIGNIPLMFKYSEDLREKVNRVENNKKYLVKIEDTNSLILKVSNILDI